MNKLQQVVIQVLKAAETVLIVIMLIQKVKEIIMAVYPQVTPVFMAVADILHMQEGVIITVTEAAVQIRTGIVIQNHQEIKLLTGIL